MPLVNLGIIGSLNADNLGSDCGDLQIASYAAIIADRSRLLRTGDRLGLEAVGYRRCWTSLRTGAATDARALREAFLHPLYNPAIKAASCHTQYKLPLYLVACSYATVAIDALAEIGNHVGMTGILLPIQVRFPFWIANGIDPHSCRDCLQFAIYINLASEAIERMVGQHELDNILP